MELTQLLESVDVERIYQHLLNLEGVRHVLDAPGALDRAGDYCHRQLTLAGARVREQEFRIDGFHHQLRNVEGSIGDESAPAAVIVAHYDTVWSTPGANDDAAGIAVLLESARVLATLPNPPAVRFVAASQEEVSPEVLSRIRASELANGITDAQHRFRSHIIASLMRQHLALQGFGVAAGKAPSEVVAEATLRLKERMPPNVLAHVRELEAIQAGLTNATTLGRTGRIGSTRWLEEAIVLGKPIRFAVALDEIGTTSKQPYSQKAWPEGVSWDMFRTYKVDTERWVADFSMVTSNLGSEGVADAFTHHCRDAAIDLPYAWAHMPLDYEGFARTMPSLLGADHAAFWRAGIPAIFVMDTSAFRNPFGHSMADTIDRLDFEQITRICKGIIATLLDPAV
jgi:hypothetical protein